MARVRVIQAPLVERERELKEFERLLGLPPALGKPTGHRLPTA
jgi:hypothetical protein